MQAQLADLDRRIANLVDAIETGADPGPIMRQLAQRTAERDALAVRMATAAGPSSLSGTQIEAIAAELGGIAEALQHATTEERAAIYASLDIRIEYDDRSHQVRATSNLARVANRVGGPIRTRRPRSFCARSWPWQIEQPGEGSCARRPNQRTFTPSTSATRKSGSPVSTGQSSTNPAPSASSVSSKMQHFLSAASSPCNDPLEFAAPDHCLRNPLSRLERRHGHRLSTGNSRGGSWCRRSRSDHRVAVRAHAGPRHGRRPC